VTAAGNPLLGRRALLGGASVAAGGIAAMAGASPLAAEPVSRAEMLSARDFGAKGDGEADDTAALQAALDAAFAPGRASFLHLPPGDYKVTRTLRIAPPAGAAGNIGRRSGIIGHGARLVSAIDDGSDVVDIVSRSTIRFVLIEGLDILGSGRERHGINIESDRKETYFYNFCLRDIAVQDCGGDGCRMAGNVFEGQVINCYLRKNGGNGATFAHGSRGGILSAIHVFGCVFGDNGGHGAALTHGCYDVSFHGCYFLLNGHFGLVAENGCTLLSNCGFENNHQNAHSFEEGDAGIALSSFATLVGCTAYSVFNQTMLVRAFITKHLVMMGCTGSGGDRARQAGLARIGGYRTAGVSLLGCDGKVTYVDDVDGVELGGAEGGIRLASDWQSPNLPRLGDYRLWVDRRGRLRLKKGAPASDEDGAPVGT
jgi:Pectate lyase superfamily protein/Right handed beta helix region